jgi:DUF971 family protein
VTAVDERYEPLTIDVSKEEAVTITFADGYVARFELPALRRWCPCADCRGRRDRHEEVWPRSAAGSTLRIDGAELRGAYGLAIRWNDGHDAGIYSFTYLRRWHDGDVFGPAAGHGH